MILTFEVTSTLFAYQHLASLEASLELVEPEVPFISAQSISEIDYSTSLWMFITCHILVSRCM